MCVICISEKGVRQPNEKEIRNMWNRNSHGAGYMYARDGKVTIHKGFMTLADFNRAINEERFTSDDVVIYHFRISTQAGVNPEMTHPFPLTSNIEMTKKLDLICPIGIAHNGIISMTSTNNKEYSDTALFIANYLPLLIKERSDLDNARILDLIESAIGSKMVFLDGDGNITTIGNFILESDGLMYSNPSYKGYEAYKKKESNKYKYGNDYFNYNDNSNWYGWAY